MQAAKQLLRKEYKAALAKLIPEFCTAESAQVFATLTASPLYLQATHVCLYLPAKQRPVNAQSSSKPALVTNEIGTIPILMHALSHSKKCYVPILVSADDMRMVQVQDLYDYTNNFPLNKFGIPEPALDSLALRQNCTLHSF